jgi:D-alanyl-D-alanine carboxypeptidase/D-alanyl-D-alanine-endopeptidase (penicillin-binding protein 4)
MKHKAKKILFAVILITFLADCACANLEKRIKSIIRQTSQKDVEFSIKIIRADSGKTIFSHRGNTAILPASNMKLIITAAAIEHLGPDYEFVTRVGLCGESLVVIGSGDPLLGDGLTDSKDGRQTDWIFKKIADALKARSVTTIKDILIDTTIFDDQRIHPNWPVEQLNRWYACEVSGLNFNRNCIDLTTENLGGKIKIIMEPETDFLKLINKVKPIGKGKGAVGSYRTSVLNEIIVYGKCRKKQGPFAVAIERPAALFGYMLAEKLSEMSIAASGELIESSLDPNCQFEQITQFTTAISRCLQQCNKNSFALATEALLKTIAAKSNPDGKNGSWQKGTSVINEYLSSLGIERAQFYIDDASGLSRENYLSANAITTTLLHVYKSGNWKLYKNSLAVGGIDGTIARYFKEKAYKGKIFGKTGYISRVKSFSGFCETTHGDYIFSILANDATGKTREAINDICKAIIDNK